MDTSHAYADATCTDAVHAVMMSAATSKRESRSIFSPTLFAHVEMTHAVGTAGAYIRRPVQAIEPVETLLPRHVTSVGHAMPSAKGLGRHSAGPQHRSRSP